MPFEDNSSFYEHSAALDMKVKGGHIGPAIDFILTDISLNI